MEGPSAKMRSLSGFESMNVNHHDLLAGIDFPPLPKGLDMHGCHCLHYGYIINGSLKVSYDDRKA